MIQGIEAPLGKGDTVWISGAAGECRGYVLEAVPVGDLPEVPDVASSVVKDILREMEVDFVAIIAHFHDRERVMFCALHQVDGSWWDLKRRRLSIRVESRGD